MSKFFPSYKEYDVEYWASGCALWFSGLCVATSFHEDYGCAIATGLLSGAFITFEYLYSNNRRINKSDNKFLEDIE
ncbi:MAG: hypothetical protein ABIF40_00475 [archaeon]